MPTVALEADSLVVRLGDPIGLRLRLQYEEGTSPAPPASPVVAARSRLQPGRVEGPVAEGGVHTLTYHYELRLYEPGVHRVEAPAVAFATGAGDSLWRIARLFNTTVALIQRSNGLDPENPNIYPGQVLRIFKANWRIEATKAAFVLCLLNEDELVKVYRTGVGRQDRTPVGDFVISNKEREPTWSPPGRVIPYGHPDNVLGTRWLGLQPVGETSPQITGYGIHGTSDPSSIGSAVSNGCIRMLNANVEELFDVVCEGTPVRLTD